MTRPGREAYERFLRSKEWQNWRMVAIDMAGSRCQQCGREEELEVHHKTYVRFGGQERLSDLAVLCASCHSRVHAKRPEPVGPTSLGEGIADYRRLKGGPRD